MESIEFEGKNTEEAIYKACKYFSTTPEKLEITILTTGSTGIFGLVGGKKAKIRALYKEEPAEKEPLVDLTDLEEEFGRKKKEEKAAEEPKPAPVESKPQRREAAAEAVPVPETERAEEVETEEEEPVETGEADQEALDTARDMLERLLSLAGMASRVEGEISEGRIKLNVIGESSSLLIGKKGKTLDALQFLLSKMLSKKMGKRIHMVVDTENYRDRRKKSLFDMALRLGEKAKKAGKPITMSPMNAHDRRVIHLALQNDKQLRTKSKGEGLLKRIIILPQRAAKSRSSKRS